MELLPGGLQPQQHALGKRSAKPTHSRKAPPPYTVIEPCLALSPGRPRASPAVLAGRLCSAQATNGGKRALTSHKARKGHSRPVGGVALGDEQQLLRLRRWSYGRDRSGRAMRGASHLGKPGLLSPAETSFPPGEPARRLARAAHCRRRQ